MLFLSDTEKMNYRNNESQGQVHQPEIVNQGVGPDVGQGCRGFQSANLHFLTFFLVIKKYVLIFA